VNGYNRGFRVVLRSAHVLLPLLLISPQGGTTCRDTRTGRVLEMRTDPREQVCPQSEGRRTVPDRSGPRARREAGRQPEHRLRRAHTEIWARPGHRARPRLLLARLGLTAAPRGWLGASGAMGLLNPTAQQPAHTRYHPACMLVLTATQPAPLARKAQI
jgi:hypothetical protein